MENMDVDSDGVKIEVDSEDECSLPEQETPKRTQKRQSLKHTKHVEVTASPLLPPAQNERPRKSEMNCAMEEEEDDDCHPITVESKSICKSNGTTLSLMTYDQVNLLSHCIFCLRKTSKIGETQVQEEEDPEMLQTVSRSKFMSSSSSSSTLVSSFNQTWSYISAMQSGNIGHDPDDHLNLNSLLSDKVTFSELPRLCHFCAETLNTIDRLLKDLKAQLDVLGKVDQVSKYGGKYSWRAEQFERKLRSSGLDADVFNATVSILNNLGKGSAVLKDDPLLLKNITSSQPETCKESRTATYSTVADDPEDSEQDFTDEGDESLESDEDHSDFEWDPDSQDPLRSDEDSRPKPESSNRPSTSELQQQQRKNGVTMSFLVTSADTAQKKSLPERSNIPSRTRSGHLRIPVKVAVQTCDLCKIEVPITDIYHHVKGHVGEDYLVPCPSPKCPYIYSTPRSLYRHLYKNAGGKICCQHIPNVKEVLEKAKNNVCEVCGYRAKTLLHRHVNRMHETPTKNFSCPIKNCRQRFTVKQSVGLHLTHHQDDNDLRSVLARQRCAACSGMIKPDEMENHLKTTHSAEQVIKCHRCPYLFSSREHLVHHLWSHRNGILSCDICGDDVKFTRYNKLREHYFNVHQVGTKYPCDRCNFVLWTKNRLMEHIKYRHENCTKKVKNLEYKCDSCEAVFKADFSLRDHQIRVHKAERYVCRYCPETFSIEKVLLKHEREHIEGPLQDKVYTCEVEGCGKDFKAKSTLRDHVSAVHLRAKTYVCELCGKSYGQKSGLYTHNKDVHLKIRAHVCEHCGERFPGKNGLMIHQRIHSLERPFTCDVCGQRFRHKTVLKRHVEGHQRKGADFKPNGPMKHIRKRVKRK